MAWFQDIAARPGRSLGTACAALGAVVLGGAVLSGLNETRAEPARAGTRCAAASVPAIMSCLGAARSGGTILIAPGTYGALAIEDVHKAVTLAAADPANRPRFTGQLDVRRSSGLTLRGFEVIASTNAPFQISGGSNITIDRTEVRSQSSQPGQYHKGLFIRDGSKITVTNSWFHDLSSGLTFNGLTDGVLSYNLFTRISDDALFGTNSLRTRITHNFGGSFTHEASDPTHPDYIQIASAFGPNIDLEISNNVYVRGPGGSLSQCVFGGAGAMPPRFAGQPSYVRPVIKGNLCVGATYNGVSELGGEDAMVTDNIALAGPDVGSWVAVRGGHVRELSGNVGFVMRGTAVNVIGQTKVASARGNVLTRKLSQAELDELGGVFAAMAKPGELRGVYEAFRERVLNTVGLETGSQGETPSVRHCGGRCRGAVPSPSDAPAPSEAPSSS